MVVDRINKPSRSCIEWEGYFWGAVLNPLHLCGWRPGDHLGDRHRTAVSTHTTLASGDIFNARRASSYPRFNPHHPREMETSDSFDLKSRQCFNPRHPQRTAAFYFAIRSSLICEVLSRVTASKAVTLALISSTFSATWSSFWNFSFMPC